MIKYRKYIRKHEYFNPKSMIEVPVIVKWNMPMRYWTLLWIDGTREQRDLVFEVLCARPSAPFSEWDFVGKCSIGGRWHSIFPIVKLYLEAPNPIIDVQIEIQV